ncbi:MAG TPA: putative quinol monooxygenase [Methylomirabilota bacterium]|nr:putative quinol monooxygenase [Methylomirabilota bacterium]
MHVIVAEFRTRPDRAEALGRVLDRQARNSVEREPGCLVFDVCQDEDPTKFLLYEVYRDRAAIEAHRKTAHYAQFRAASAPLILERRVRIIRRRPVAGSGASGSRGRPGRRATRRR